MVFSLPVSSPFVNYQVALENTDKKHDKTSNDLQYLRQYQRTMLLQRCLHDQHICAKIMDCKPNNILI